MIHACVNLSPNIWARSLEVRIHAVRIFLHSLDFLHVFNAEHSDTNPSEKMNPDLE